MSNLQSIGLGGNDIHDTGALHLANALKVNTKLRSLGLGGNQISEWAWLGGNQISEWAWLGGNQISEWAWLGGNQISEWAWLGGSEWAWLGGNQISEWAWLGGNQISEWVLAELGGVKGEADGRVLSQTTPPASRSTKVWSGDKRTFYSCAESACSEFRTANGWEQMVGLVQVSMGWVSLG